jgi:lipoprotein-anchoring transpeptidase ErfK/SrfK
VGMLLSMAGLALLAAPEEPAPVRAPEFSGALAIADKPAQADKKADAAPAEDKRPLAIRNLRVDREIAVTRWLEPGEYVWDEEAAAAARGPATVVVNLRSRTLSVYRDGTEVGRSSILYGYGEHPTPLGTFKVLQKKKDHISNIYNAPMPHMLRLTNDGIALHGSPQVVDDGATHGCVGLPLDFAALLFTQVGMGDTVVIWSGRADG